jgi:heat shock protein HslJ
VTVGEPVTPTLTAPLVEVVPAAPAVSFSDLTGKAWQWVAFGDAVTGVQEIANASRYQITFQPNGIVRVQADCNRGAGQYSVDGASIGVNIQTMTRAMCPPGSLSNEFVQRLNAAAIWFVQDGDLFFDLFADSGTMRFALVE